jgi:hypothetical protein
MDAFTQSVSEYTQSRFGIDTDADSVDLTYSVALFDAIMLYAHAATRVLSEGGSLNDGEAVVRAVRNTSFVGIGGSRVVLDEYGDRIESYEVMNYVLDAGDVMRSVAVGLYNSTVQQYEAYERETVWPGNTIEVPADRCSGHRNYTCNWAGWMHACMCDYLVLVALRCHDSLLH